MLLHRAITVLGVDFMSENVRAILDEAGHSDVPVYRMASEHIGCSLAEAAESPAYDSFLAQASATPNSVHVSGKGRGVGGVGGGAGGWRPPPTRCT